jgi:hypothetical protein
LGGFSTDMKCGDFKDSKSNPKCGDLGGWKLDTTYVLGT